MDDLAYWVSITNISGIGPHKFKKLLKHFNSVQKIWNASNKELQQTGLNEQDLNNFLIYRQKNKPQQLLDNLHKKNIQITSLVNSKYPKLLKEISVPPTILYTQGNLSLLSQICISIVGTRKITSYGKKILDTIIPPLVQNDITIISGLAYGVDAYTHKKTLECNGNTVAVLPVGLDNIYPSGNQRLATEILKNNGLLLSEYGIITKMSKGNFVSRNRIISGLSPATIVIEAGTRSGSLITASFALEQNREVLAIPGNIFNKMSEGTNSLIDQGAKVITSANDILKILKIPLSKKTPPPLKQLSLTNEEEQIISILNKNSLHINDIIRKSELNIQQISIIITNLEMKNVIKCIGNKTYHPNT